MALASLGLAAWGCANTIAPQGGPQDETPPQLDTAASTPNYQTRFEKQPIDLVFDEWVQLEDIATQVVVSPPVDNFDVRMRRKGIRFTFGDDEELLEDATYTINFGSSVRDLTEGNAAENLRFVFSTGDVLDSLEVAGRILDALTNEPVEGSLFMLYENTADSVVRTERPFYFARSDTAGRFLISNVKGGTFKGFALTDDRPNYQFDAGEAIGFPDSLILLDSSRTPRLEIMLFKEVELPNFIDEEQEGFGQVKLIFDSSPEAIEVSTPNGPSLFPEVVQDSLIVWYSEPTDNAWNLAYRLDTLLADTVRIDPQDGEAFLERARLRRQPRPERLDIHPRRPLLISFNHPLAVIDTPLVRLTSDSLPNPVSPRASIDSTDFRRIRVDYNWRTGYPYRLELLPGALFDIFGIGNGDTIAVDLRTKLPSDYGNLNLVINGLDSTMAYVLELRDPSDEIVAERLISATAEYTETFPLLPPATYQVRLITDRNGNGQWDTGNYDLKRQPEPIYLKELEQLRANWDLDAEINFIEGSPPSPTGS